MAPEICFSFTVRFFTVWFPALFHFLWLGHSKKTIVDEMIGWAPHDESNSQFLTPSDPKERRSLRLRIKDLNHVIVGISDDDSVETIEAVIPESLGLLLSSFPPKHQGTRPSGSIQGCCFLQNPDRPSRSCFIPQQLKGTTRFSFPFNNLQAIPIE